MKKILFAVLGVTLLMSSCKDEPKIDVSYEKALMDKHWVLTDVTNNPNVNEPLNVWTSSYASLPPCLKDNKWYFTSKTQLNILEHWTKCSPSDPDTRELYYGIQNDNYIRIYSNPSDIDNSISVQGDFNMVDINTFTIDSRTKVDDATTTSTIYTYSKEVQ